jgi:hypothetical protein
MRLLSCAVVLFALAAGASESIESRSARPFASKDQSRKWRVEANRPYYPKGGVCLSNMYCACSQPRDIDGTCPGTTTCASTTAGTYCVYLCNDPMYCMSMTAEECNESQPCNP